jgi:hypothetical protein
MKPPINIPFSTQSEIKQDIFNNSKEIDETMGDAFLEIQLQVASKASSLPVTQYTYGDTNNLEGIEELKTPQLSKITQKITETYIPLNKTWTVGQTYSQTRTASVVVLDVSTLALLAYLQE